MQDGVVIVSDYRAFVQAIRDRAEALNVSRAAIDERAGLQDGYAAKLLAPAAPRSFGAMSMWATLGALGLRLALVVDGEADLTKLPTRRVRRPARKGEQAAA